MPGPSKNPWSDNSNAPKIPYQEYFQEKTILAGLLLGAISYGIVIALFFQCMGALFDPTNRMKGGVKWGLVAHTTVMFSFLTIPAAMRFNMQSVGYIDGREFTGVAGALPPGPLGYQYSAYTKAILVVTDMTYPLNQWLADGLLLYRCYIIYSMNYLVIAFPCLMYLSSMAVGLMSIYESVQPAYLTRTNSLGVDLGLSFYSISISLNVILTLMIVIRLILHRRNIRAAMGTRPGAGELYKAVVTMLVESYALYAVTFLIFIVPWAMNNYAAYIFAPIGAATQVIAPFLVILRVANRRALTSESVASPNIGSIRFGGQGESADDDGSLPDGDLVGSMGTNGETPGTLDVAIETTIEEVPL